MNVTKMTNKEFVDFLFDKLACEVDTDMIDLQDDDTCCDHINFQQLELFWVLLLVTSKSPP